MATEHRVYYQDARDLSDLRDSSIELVVTSPPYPMIEMWDALFFQLNPRIKDCLDKGDYWHAYEYMHLELRRVWAELFRVMKPGAFACINIGDATRTINGKFQLFPNHSRIMHDFTELGFDALPLVLWRKQTNAPNKFMGSGMLPAGAYVTLEHEYILIFRKGNKRVFSSEAEKQNRMESALFWEERNSWFSDLWEFKGSRQVLNGKGKNTLRQRSGAFPFILPFRLINMYSVLGDTVLDPFLGTGTTMLAAMACGRNSIGYEIEPLFADHLNGIILQESLSLNRFQEERINNHLGVVKRYLEERNKPFKHQNRFYNFPVMTKQETLLKLPVIQDMFQQSSQVYTVKYVSPEKIKQMVETRGVEQIFSTLTEKASGKNSAAQLTIDF